VVKYGPPGDVAPFVLFVMAVSMIVVTGDLVFDNQRDAVEELAVDKCTERFNTTQWRWSNRFEGNVCVYNDTIYQPRIILRNGEVVKSG